VGARAVLQRRFHEHYAFFCYAAAVVLGSAFQFIAYFSAINYSAYFRVYWATQAIVMVFAFAAVFEVASELALRYRPQLSTRQKLILPLTAVLTAMIGFSILGTRGTFVETVLALQNLTRAFQVGSLCLVLLGAAFFRLRLPQQTFAIAIGFGVYGSAQAMMMALRRYGLIAGDVLSVADPLVFNFVALFWIKYLYQSERQPVARVLPAIPIKEWNQALGEVLHR
jgi:hypothetical protein